MEVCMKKNLLLASFAYVLLCATSCTTVKKTASTVNVQNTVCTTPTVADLEVMNKVELRKEWHFRPFHIGEPKLGTVKGNFISESLQKLDADILLEPQVSFSRTSYGPRVLIITGYPAKYKNFRKATGEDLEALNACSIPDKSEKLNASSGGLIGIFKKEVK